MNGIICELCPRACSLKPGQVGVCGARIADAQRVIPLNHGCLSAVHVDPIEKKPLYHFYPGCRALSLGGFGCNLMCRGCQNASISRARADCSDGFCMLPQDIVAHAQKYACPVIAYTYNEPIVWHEFACETAQAARETGIKNIMVTAGYVTANAREKIFAHMDAANVDLKGFTETFYRSWAKAELALVLETIEYLHHLPGFWLELTTLLIPGQNDAQADLEAEFSWIAERLGTDIPIHLSAFHPAWQAKEIPATPIETLEKALKLAKEAGLHHVYLGNVPLSSDTVCPKCGQLLISRWGYHTEIRGLKNGKCSACDSQLAGVFAL